MRNPFEAVDGFVEADVFVVDGLTWGDTLGFVGLEDLLSLAVEREFPLAEGVALKDAPPGRAVAVRTMHRLSKVRPVLEVWIALQGAYREIVVEGVV